MGSLLLPFSPLINDTNENPSFYGPEFLLEAVSYLQFQTILVTYIIIIILGFIFSSQYTCLSVLMDLKTMMHMIFLIMHDELLLIRNTKPVHMWVVAFLILETDNPLYMDLSLPIMASNTPLVALITH